MDKTTIALLILLGISTIAMFSLKPEQKEMTSFESYKKQYGKSYMGQVEQEYRRTVFLKNVIKIEQHNANKDNTYTQGINQFTDLTQEEFIATYLNTKVNTKYSVDVNVQAVDPLRGDIDWVAAGKVSGVKDQGQCGSCWAFSAVAAIQSANLISTGSSDNLSEQQLVDCSRSYGNQGCNGGWMDSAFQYVKDHGLTTTSAYPYVARDQSCKIDSGAGKINGFVDVPGCDNLLNALSSRPVSVAVDASVWSSYRSGVLSNCGSSVNHGVLLVGATDAFWKIKNSWGSGWGQTGFIRLNRGNTCAVCSYPSYPTL